MCPGLSISFEKFSLFHFGFVQRLAGFLTIAFLGAPLLSASPLQSIPAGKLGTKPIAAFSIGACEVTWDEWARVHAWAEAHGYAFGGGAGESPGHPVSLVSWYDAVKFCNAASELAGLKPVYYEGPDRKAVYRQGEMDLGEDCVDPVADGYRLPTENEWEYAARAGITTDYLWGDDFDPKSPNAYAWSYDKTNSVNPHPAGRKKANGFGLYDVSGNVAEWTFSRYNSTAPWRVQRGGSVALDSDLSLGFRSPVPPATRLYDVGLRVASSAPNTPSLQTIVSEKKLPAPAAASPLAPVYDGSDSIAVARKLFSLINLDFPGLEKVRALHRAGHEVEALDAWRDALVERLQHHPVADPAWNGGKKDETKLYMVDPSSIRWFRDTDRPQSPYQSDYVNLAGAALLPSWFKAGNTASLEQWLALVDAFSARAKLDFDNLSPAGRAMPNAYFSPQTWDFGMGFVFYSDKWWDTLNFISLHVAHGDVPRIFPAREMANLAIFTLTDDVSKFLKDPRNAVGNQQISMATALIKISRLLPEARDAGAFADLGVDRVRNGTLAKFVLKDGGDLEQSFNYNQSFINAYVELNDLYAGEAIPGWLASMRQSCIYRLRLFNCLRYASGTGPSVGNNSYGRDLQETCEKGDLLYDPLVEQILDRLVQHQRKGLPAPAFTSIAFPYSGYYLQRDGWTNQSSSLFFKSSRPGRGHNHADNNNIGLVAYGRHLLVDRESPPYNVGHLPEDQKKDFDWILEYKGENAIWADNTVLIDGAGQDVGQSSGGYPGTIPDQPWFTSPALDFVQGVCLRHFAIRGMDAQTAIDFARTRGATGSDLAAMTAGGKAVNAAGPVEFSATQTRQVIYLKQANAWIVTDRARREDGRPVRTLTQLWHFPKPMALRTPSAANKINSASTQKAIDAAMVHNVLGPGFTGDQVIVDDKAGTLLTTNPGNVNLALFNVAPAPMHYEKFFGAQYPMRGWANLAPSMVSGYVPAVDVHATTETDDNPLVTLLVPIPQGQTTKSRIESIARGYTDGVGHLNVAFTDGTRVDYAASATFRPLTAGPVHESAEALLLLTQSDGSRRGVVINGPGGSYAFELAGNEEKKTHSIVTPSSFSWKQTDQGFIPVYK